MPGYTGPTIDDLYSALLWPGILVLVGVIGYIYASYRERKENVQTNSTTNPRNHHPVQ